MARLPRLMGRGRALEVLLGADDVHGDLAERYGYVNRSLPDSDLDSFVDALAMRIASFDKDAIAETKRLVNVASLPPDLEIKPEWEAFMASLGRLQPLPTGGWRAQHAGVGPAVVGVIGPRIVTPADFEASFAPAERSQPACNRDMLCRTCSGEKSPDLFLSGQNSSSRRASTTSERSASGNVSKMKRSNLTAFSASGSTSRPASSTNETFLIAR